jgi:phosphoribosylanthranilate isomerase
VKAKELGKPVFLAGGLNPDNVKEAIKKTAPFAVDVASGVEKSPKKKDLEKLKEFINHAKG